MNIPPPPPSTRSTLFRVVSTVLYVGPVVLMTIHTWQLGLIWLFGFAWVISDNINHQRNQTP
jgi:hypothetical protein